MKCGFIATLALLLLSNESLPDNNPLLGSWLLDNSKTLENFTLPTDGSEKLKSDAARAKRFVEAKVKQLGSNMTLTHSERECVETLFDNKGNVISKESFPYKVIKLKKDFIIVDQLKNGGVSKIFLSDNIFYVEVKFGEYTYRDYFTRL